MGAFTDKRRRAVFAKPSLASLACNDEDLGVLDAIIPQIRRILQEPRRLLAVVEEPRGFKRLRFVTEIDRGTMCLLGNLMHESTVPCVVIQAIRSISR